MAMTEAIAPQAPLPFVGDMPKRCARCKQSLPRHMFYVAQKRRSGLHPWCIPCCKVSTRTSYLKNTATWHERDRQWKAKNPERWEAIILRHKLKGYGISLQDYQHILSVQGERCAICREAPNALGRVKRLCVDHNHTTGAVRGLLCQACNKGLGTFGDDIPRLLAAARYLLETK